MFHLPISFLSSRPHVSCGGTKQNRALAALRVSCPRASSPRWGPSSARNDHKKHLHTKSVMLDVECDLVARTNVAFGLARAHGIQSYPVHHPTYLFCIALLGEMHACLVGPANVRHLTQGSIVTSTHSEKPQPRAGPVSAWVAEWQLQDGSSSWAHLRENTDTRRPSRSDAMDKLRAEHFILIFFAPQALTQSHL